MSEVITTKEPIKKIYQFQTISRLVTVDLIGCKNYLNDTHSISVAKDFVSFSIVAVTNGG